MNENPTPWQCEVCEKYRISEASAAYGTTHIPVDFGGVKSSVALTVGMDCPLSFLCFSCLCKAVHRACSPQTITDPITGKIHIVYGLFDSKA